MKYTFLILFFSCTLYQQAFSQFEEYTNKRVQKYFSSDNELFSLSSGIGVEDYGYQVSVDYARFIKDGISWGWNVTVLFDHPDYLFTGTGNNVRGYLFHNKIRPFVEVNHEFRFGRDLIFNIGLGGGISIAGITNMIGLELKTEYKVPYLNFRDNEKLTPYIIPTIGLHLQW